MIKCAYAQSGIFIGTQGNAMPCCDYDGVLTDNKGRPFSIHTHSFDEIHQSTTLINLRQQLNQDQRPTECSRCWNREDNNLESRRTLAQGRLSNIYDKVDWEQGNLLFFGGFLGNICNLGCRICNPALSSVLATEHQQIHFNKNAEWVKQDYFWNNLKQATSIENYEMLGGEPLYQKNFLNFLDHLVETGRSKDCAIDVVTNGTVYPKIVEQADKFQQLTFNVSIDNIGDKFELERHGADWNKVNNNIDKMMSQKKKHSNLLIRSTTAVNIQNVLDLPELHQYFVDKQFDSYWFGIVDGPKWVSIKNMTAEAKQLVLSKLEKYQTVDQMSGIIKIIKKSQDSDGKDFVKQTKIIDQRRGQDFRNSHADIAKAMGYV